MSKGWECPVCGNGVAPWKDECSHDQISGSFTAKIGPVPYMFLTTTSPDCSTETLPREDTT